MEMIHNYPKHRFLGIVFMHVLITAVVVVVKRCFVLQSVFLGTALSVMGQVSGCEFLALATGPIG